MTTEVVPVAVVVPTRNRAAVLRRTLESLGGQSVQPAELVIVDASCDTSTRTLCADGSIPELRSALSWLPAKVKGAASQRNQGVSVCSQPVIGFLDDDILFEPMCVARLWRALQSDPLLG